MLWLRNLAATLLIPGTVAGVVPYLIVSRSGAHASTGALAVGGLASCVAGASILLWSVARFAIEGQGTLAPVDPPTRLVQSGLYRYTRNPMYAGVFLVLCGECLLFPVRALIGYAAFFFIAANLFILFYEEPTLRRTFGVEYDDYCRRVGRWGL
jgi:protein-S-isoprenylcysteine O-methyltransferase Ste14